MTGDTPDHSRRLAELVGQQSGPPTLSPVPVNEPMIIHWVEAMDDHDPVYVDPAAARSVGLDGVIAPPSMLQAWVMRGLRASQAADAARAAGQPAGANANDEMMALLDEEGLTSVVATNCEQSYDRPLVVGDRLVSTSVIESISDVKTTGLGAGRFVTTRLEFVAVPEDSVGPDPDVAALGARGEPVATMRFRILKFRPRAAAPAKPPRPRPAQTEDNAFFFEGLREGHLLIQRCTNCGTLRHPPLPGCGHCGSLDWDTVESSGRGELYSYVVVHYPQVPSFDYPLAIGLVALEEGTRVVANLDVAPDRLGVGLPVVARLVAFDDELTLPVFEAADASAVAEAHDEGAA